MILKSRVVRQLLERGFSVAAHTYLRPGGSPKYTVVAKHPGTGILLQGWSRGGPATDALRDLERQAAALWSTP